MPSGGGLFRTASTTRRPATLPGPGSSRAPLSRHSQNARRQAEAASSAERVDDEAAMHSASGEFRRGRSTALRLTVREQAFPGYVVDIQADPLRDPGARASNSPVPTAPPPALARDRPRSPAGTGRARRPPRDCEHGNRGGRSRAPGWHERTQRAPVPAAGSRGPSDRPRSRRNHLSERQPLTRAEASARLRTPRTPPNSLTSDDVGDAVDLQSDVPLRGVVGSVWGLLAPRNCATCGGDETAVRPCFIDVTRVLAARVRHAGRAETAYLRGSLSSLRCSRTR
jgi:hypothetical protein